MPRKTYHDAPNVLSVNLQLCAASAEAGKFNPTPKPFDLGTVAP